MKLAAVASKPKRELFWAVGLLAVLLGLLFWKSFLPDFVHFSNDGPLGEQNTDWQRLPAAFTGTWDDLNDIGTNAGTFPVCLTALIRWALGPVGFAKFYAPIALLILGFGAWVFFKQLKFSLLATILGSLAAALVSLFFSDACWGVATHQIAFGMDFLALSLIVSNSSTTPLLLRWIRMALAGLAVGVNVSEAADIGAIFSLFVAAFTLFHSFNEEGTTLKKVGRGVGQVLIIAIFAGFLAAQTITGLLSAFGSSVTTTANSQTQEAKTQQWNFATQWSLPKIETLGIVVPGLFGYRMDTPGGGNYWGAIGRDPAWDQYFQNGEKGPAPSGTMRFSGDGYYAGVLVILVALWAIAQSLRKQNSVFSETHRRSIWFWTALLIVSLLLSWGRFAPFYAVIYHLPYFSTIRNPNKFLFVFTWALVIIFAYGVHGLSRRYLEIAATGSNSVLTQLKSWWAKVRGFDRNWISGCVLVFVGSLLAWLIYAAQKPALVRYLQAVGFPDESTAKQIAAFSVAQVGWFILFFALAAVSMILILAGVFSGRRAKWAGILLGVLLVVDLGRANLPWIVFWNYPQKYDIDPNNSSNSTNPILNFLRDKSYEHRVAILPFEAQSRMRDYDNYFGMGVYRIEWAQHQFPYYNIQSLDVIQNPRPPTDQEAYEAALSFYGAPDPGQLMMRRWELTNTRYLLGAAGFLGSLNEQFDPVKQRFRIVQRFDILPKLGIDQPTQPEQLTAVPSPDGDLALFEFTGALPRAKLYSNWRVSTVDSQTLQSWVKAVQQRIPQEMVEALAQQSTNDLATLYTLASTNFDPAQTVLISSPLPASDGAGTNQNSGTVEFTSYSPKDIKFSANAITPSILLLNDKYDPNWRVFVDGRRAELLRCDYIMRGVYLTPGAHIVEFQFKLSVKPLYITLTAVGVGILLIGCLIFLTRKTESKQA